MCLLAPCVDQIRSVLVVQSVVCRLLEWESQLVSGVHEAHPKQKTKGSPEETEAQGSGAPIYETSEILRDPWVPQIAASSQRGLEMSADYWCRSSSWVGRMRRAHTTIHRHGGGPQWTAGSHWKGLDQSDGLLV